MKKTILMLTVVLASTLSSCRRTYTCSCTDSNGMMTNTTMHNTRNNCNNQCVALGTNCVLK